MQSMQTQGCYCCGNVDLHIVDTCLLHQRGPHMTEYWQGESSVQAGRGTGWSSMQTPRAAEAAQQPGGNGGRFT